MSANSQPANPRHEQPGDLYAAARTPSQALPRHDAKLALQSSDAEANVLGAMFLSGEAVSKAVAELAARDFADARNAAVFSAIQRLSKSRMAIDITTVAESLHKGAKSPETVIPYVAVLAQHAVTAAEIDAHIAIVLDYSARRSAIAAAEALFSAACDKSKPITSAIAGARDALSGIRLPGATLALTPETLVEQAVKYAKARRERKGMNLTGVADFDRATGGLHPGELTVVSGRPGEGKTTLALQTAYEFALRGQRVVFVSCEMSDVQLGERLSALCGVRTASLRSGGATDGDILELESLAGEIRRLPIAGFTSLRPPGAIRAEIQRLQGSRGVDLVVIDHLGLCAPDVDRGENQAVRVGRMTREFKLMATDLNVPVMLLSQLNRAVEGRTGRMPQLSDLRDSGSIEQDADNVVMLKMPKKPEDALSVDAQLFRELEKNGDSLTYCILAKHRNGVTADFTLAFRRREMRLISVAEAQAPPKSLLDGAVDLSGGNLPF